MECFYFKNQDIEDYARDENGIMEVDDNGKGIKVDYYSIQLKVPKEDCAYDFRKISKWTPMKLLSAFDFEALQMGQTGGMSKVQTYGAMLELLETWHTEITEKRESAIKEVTPIPEED